jgi:hypothetical protein
MKNPIVLVVLVVSGLLAFAGPAGAMEPGATLLGSSYWQEFQDHWRGIFKRQDGVGMLIVVVGAVALFIITRGKWLK